MSSFRVESTLTKKILYALVILFLCNCKYPATNSTTIVQTCLDSLRRDTDFGFLDHAEIILVKNANSSGLDDLHWGANKIALRDTATAEIRVYVPGDAITNKRYLIINKLNTSNNNARVELGLPNTNEALIVDMVKNDEGWRVKRIQSMIW